MHTKKNLLNPGSTLTISCLVTGSPQTKITWFFDDVVMTTSERVTVKEEVLEADGLKERGVREGGVEGRVREREGGEGKVVEEYDEQKRKGNDGDDGVMEGGGKRSELRVVGVKAEDGGVYRCEGDNGEGTVAKETTINVIGPPFIKPLPNVTSVSGSDVFVHCRVTGHPLKEIKWKKGLFQPLCFSALCAI